MAVGSHPSDFVGYSVGIPQNAVGFSGLLDFAGYPVGVPEDTTPTAGYVGLLDFSGLPVGVTDVVPPQPVITNYMRGGGVPIQDPNYWRKKKIWMEDDEFIARQLHDV